MQELVKRYRKQLDDLNARSEAPQRRKPLQKGEKAKAKEKGKLQGSGVSSCGVRAICGFNSLTSTCRRQVEVKENSVRADGNGGFGTIRDGRPPARSRRWVCC
eukprot:SAG11_NODE_4779_length_1768_cov_8.521270_2_plen_103_part_00